MKPNTEKRKQTKRFNFSVEGETEKWYLEWLRDVINKEPARVFNVSFNIKVEKNPVKMVKFSSPMVGEIFFLFLILKVSTRPMLSKETKRSSC